MHVCKREWANVSLHIYMHVGMCVCFSVCLYPFACACMFMCNVSVCMLHSLDYKESLTGNHIY